REEEIKRFKAREFYGIVVNTKDLKFTWQDKESNSNRTFDKKRVEKILNTIRGKEINIKDIEKQDKRSYPPGLYDLTELQRDANRIFAYSAKETLSIMQRL